RPEKIAALPVVHGETPSLKVLRYSLLLTGCGESGATDKIVAVPQVRQAMPDVPEFPYEPLAAETHDLRAGRYLAIDAHGNAATSSTAAKKGAFIDVLEVIDPQIFPRLFFVPTIQSLKLRFEGPHRAI